MHLKTRNVNTAFHQLVTGFDDGSIPTVRRSSRYGDVRMVEEPVIITYERPLERVLFNPYRDCNPFFHVYEALWMLAGRNDVAPLKYYVSRMDEFSDDGKTFNGAYGYRWRKSVGGCEYDLEDGQQYHDQTRYDQLNIIVDQLKRKPDSRRVVLQMWNVEDDLLKIDSTKDVCCNTHAYFSLRPLGHCSRDHQDPNCPCAAKGHKPAYVLDMTVCNRSNDLVWGMLGANVVHFSVLQEYLAAHVGCGVGLYHHMTNNLHAYDKTWEPDKWLQDYHPGGSHSDHWYGNGNCDIAPLVKDPAVFDKEVGEFVDRHQQQREVAVCWNEPFLDKVAEPMCMAYHRRKAGDIELCQQYIRHTGSMDWRTACEQWVGRREAAKKDKAAT